MANGYGRPSLGTGMAEEAATAKERRRRDLRRGTGAAMAALRGARGAKQKATADRLRRR